MKSLLKPSLNWLLVFVPVAVMLRIWPQLGNETALFICSCFAMFRRKRTGRGPSIAL
jgi:hypothetical protein